MYAGQAADETGLPGRGNSPKADLSGGLEDKKRRQGRSLETGVGQAQEIDQRGYQGRYHGRRQR